MEKLLMLGSNSASTQLIKQAKQRGMYTIATDYLPRDRSAAKQAADEYWMISTDNLDALEEKCRAEGITAVISGISEFNVSQTIQLCDRLGLPCWCTPDLWKKLSQKHTFKQLCRENGVPVATDYYLSDPPTEEELDAVRYPVVVKPVDLSANRGVSFCYNREELIKACAYARSLSSNEALIVERMLHGDEYAAYYTVAEGEASLLALVLSVSQPGYPSDCYSFSYTTGYNLSEYLQTFNEPVCRMLKSAGCKNGVCFVQSFRDDDGHFYAVEMGYRLSGDMFARPFRKYPGFNSYDWVLDSVMGIEHSAAQLPRTGTGKMDGYACSYIFWSKSEGTVAHIEGAEAICSLPDVELEYVVREGSSFSAYQYLMVITFNADSREAMIEMIKKVNNTVRILDQTGKNPVIYFDDFNRLIETESEQNPIG